MPTTQTDRRSSRSVRPPQPIQGAPGPSARPTRVRLRTLLRVASVACGIQFGWALQLSLLTPYVQELGVPHAWSSIIWLCGPLSGLFVQPIVGHVSDRSTSRFGRRRPFILAGAVSIIISVLVISFSADIGWLLGDRGEKKMRAVVTFVIGFWILDVANNMTQGPCRALLADLTGNDHRRTRVANAYFSLFMAVGNVLGYATGSYSSWFKQLTNRPPLIPVKYLLLGTFQYLPGPVWTILLVTALTWIGWFPFILFDTDWMGREIYGGEPNDGKNYAAGVRMGSLGLMLNSVVLGITSVLMEKLCRKWGAGFTWGLSNILMSLCFVAMIVIAAIRSSLKISSGLPPDSIVAAALVVFTLLGIPLSITYSVPYALVATRIEALGLGQGLSMGVLNLAIVIPQVIVSLGAGPWDQLFGGGNSPAIAVAAVSAFVGGLIAILAIPRTRVPPKPKGHP